MTRARTRSICVSCATDRRPAERRRDPARNGLSLTDDGRVFFTTASQLVLRDTNEKHRRLRVGSTERRSADELISTGIAPIDSGLLSVSADGTDAFFFTRDTLVPQRPQRRH